KATFKFENPKSTATAFLLTRPAPAAPQKAQWILVTAGHVFESMAGDEATLQCRRKESDGVYKRAPLKLALRKAGKPVWTKHPSADVAAIYVVPPADDTPKLPISLLATDDSLKQCDIHPGDRLMCLGYPHRVESNDAGFPVLRNGPIASFPLLPTKVTK